MTQVPIIEEALRIRQAYAAEFNYENPVGCINMQ